MPIVRYFIVVGGALLGLLFAVNWYVASVPAGSSTLPIDYSPLTPQADEPNIRIHSDRKWPEKLIFDTNLPRIGPSAP
jgi:hypothetical protein